MAALPIPTSSRRAQSRLRPSRATSGHGSQMGDGRGPLQLRPSGHASWLPSGSERERRAAGVPGSRGWRCHSARTRSRLACDSRRAERALVVEPTSAEVTWCWAIIPIDDSTTRLLSRVRVRVGTRLLLWMLAPAIDLPWFLMERRMLHGIARRAEALAGSRGGDRESPQSRSVGYRRLPAKRRLEVA